MKNRYLLLIFILCLAFALFFVSCGKEKAPAETEPLATDSDTATVTETEPPESEPLPEETEETEADEELREPVENEKALEFIEFQYKKACEIIDWLENRSLPADLSIALRDEEGNIYFRVIDTEERPELDGESISSFASLRKYISSVFTRSIANELIDLAKENYTDFEGNLCLIAILTDIEPDEDESGVVSTEFFLSKFTEKLFRYTAKVTYSTENEVDSEENVKYFDFIFENTGSGWYWTAFPRIDT